MIDHAFAQVGPMRLTVAERRATWRFQSFHWRWIPRQGAPTARLRTARERACNR